MGINLNLDYNYLFSSLSSTGNQSSGMSSMNFLSDYASIRNGSYGKLLKSYYAKQSAEDKNTDSTKESQKDSVKALSNVKTEAKDLSESAEELTRKDSKSLFKEDNRDAIYKAVKDFTQDYNNLLDASGKTDVKGIKRTAKSMTTMTNTYKNLLSSVGVEVGKDNKLTIDEKAFKEADFSKIKSLFNGNNSYSYNVSAKSSMIQHTAESEAKKGTFYNGNAMFDNSAYSGSIFDSYL